MATKTDQSQSNELKLYLTMDGPYYIISGQTYHHRKVLTAYGFIYDDKSKTWSYHKSGPRTRGMIKHFVQSLTKEARIQPKYTDTENFTISVNRLKVNKKHKDMGWPIFHNETGECSECLHNIFMDIKAEDLTHEIRGCPVCKYSYIRD